jgi:peptidoglycan/LPS O-acetylase OafA/YrhL
MFRRDIQGIRALAVALVVTYHAGAPWLPGGYVGVDVFFVISGYLITGIMVRELERDRTISWREFYARRARRILPAAAVALVASTILTFAFLPKIRWASIGWDTLFSSLYVQNWRLAQTSTDYLAGTAAPSPLQHFWSLAVEEQFYLIWPVLLLAVTWSLRRQVRASRGRLLPRRKTRLVLFAGFLLVALPSFAWSVLLTETDPGRAYFVTPTRLWELALGAGLAIAATGTQRLPRLAASILAWSGLAAIVYAALTFTAETPFPGWRALLPTVGAGAMLYGGATAFKWGPEIFLGLPPVKWLGDVSYSYYLWHWPLIIFVAAALDEPLTLTQSTSVVILALVPAWLSYRFVERPIQFSVKLRQQVQRSLQLGVWLTLAGVLTSVILLFSTWPPSPSLGANSAAPGQAGQLTDQKYGAEVLSPNPRNDPAGAPVDRVKHLLLTPEQARTNIAACDTRLDSSDVRTDCTYGDARARVSVAVVGDSHAAQWAPAFDVAGQRKGWAVTVYAKQLCPLADVTPKTGGAPDKTCVAWNRQVMNRLLKDPPDYIVTSNIDREIYDGNGASAGPRSVNLLAAGLVSTWRKLQGAGAIVIALRNTPYPVIDIPDCISAHVANLTKCTFSRARGNAHGLAIDKAAADAHVPVLDLNDAICPTQRCAPVIGSEIVYVDTNHVTATYVESLTPRLESAMARLMK